MLGSPLDFHQGLSSYLHPGELKPPGQLRLADSPALSDAADVLPDGNTILFDFLLLHPPHLPIIFYRVFILWKTGDIIGLVLVHFLKKERLLWN